MASKEFTSRILRPAGAKVGTIFLQARSILNRISMSNSASSEARRRDVRLLFAYILLPSCALSFSGGSLDSYVWSILIWVSALLSIVSMYVIKRYDWISLAFGFWLVTAISYVAMFQSETNAIFLAALIIVPLVQGVLSGQLATLITTVAVLVVLLIAHISGSVRGEIFGMDHTIFLAGMGLLSISTSLLVIYQGNSKASEIREISQDRAKVRFEALTDSLTNCYNRRAFQQRMQDLLKLRAPGGKHGLIIIDLDRFKQINDTFGHETGDLVLATFTERVLSLEDLSERFFRLGGDEFAILCPNLSSFSELEEVSEQIIAITEKPISTEHGELVLEASLGLAICEATRLGVEQLYQQADVAVFSAKREVGSSYVKFDANLDSEATRKFEIEHCLKSALRQRSLRVVYQPQVDLMTGSIKSFEALARWNDPLLGRVSPSEFVPIAEQSKLIEFLDRHIVGLALREARYWLSSRQRISINVSARSLNSESFVIFVENQVKRSALNASQIELEITETALIENWSRVKENVERLRSAGVGIALDDFGVGYSSLSYLCEFPVQKIKFDRSFLKRVSDPSSALIMQSFIDLSKKLEIDLVAEGIETPEQLKLMQEIGCKTGQGYLLGKPAQRDAIIRALQVKQKAA